MAKIKLTIVSSQCRGGYHHSGETYFIEDLCPPVCHELWHSIYPFVMVLLNNGELDYGDTKGKKFEMKCPDNGLVTVRGEVID